MRQRLHIHIIRVGAILRLLLADHVFLKVGHISEMCQLQVVGYLLYLFLLFIIIETYKSISLSKFCT